jgi:hypothetical protein
MLKNKKMLKVVNGKNKTENAKRVKFRPGAYAGTNPSARTILN